MDENSTTASTMKMMNNTMPIMSAVFCLTLPVGLGIYWIAGAAVRSVQQVIINKQLDKMNVDEIIKKNMEKLNEKREKQGLGPAQINSNARQSTQNIDRGLRAVPRPDLQKQASSLPADAAGKKKARPGSLAEKANMVQEYNEKHGK